MTEPKDCALPCWTESDAFTLPCTPGCGEDSLGGFRTGCFTGPKGISLLTCRVRRRLLDCVPSQAAPAAFSTQRWQANYRLQEWSGYARDCLKNLPRAMAWNTSFPGTMGCREGKDSHCDRIKGVFCQRMILDKSRKELGPDRGPASNYLCEVE